MQKKEPKAITHMEMQSILRENQAEMPHSHLTAMMFLLIWLSFSLMYSLWRRKVRMVEAPRKDEEKRLSKGLLVRLSILVAS